VTIYLLGLAKMTGVDLQDQIEAKMAKNAARVYRRLDLPGAATLSAGLLLVVLPLVLGRSEGWPAWTWICLGASVPAVALFLATERRMAARGGSPLVSVQVLARPPVSWALLTLLAATPQSRIVYADYDPVVLSHAQALLTSSPEGQTSRGTCPWLPGSRRMSPMHAVRRASRISPSSLRCGRGRPGVSIESDNQIIWSHENDDRYRGIPALLGSARCCRTR
jgi:hypothetical protein